jgi:hypothetical protein
MQKLLLRLLSLSQAAVVLSISCRKCTEGGTRNKKSALPEQHEDPRASDANPETHYLTSTCSGATRDPELQMQVQKQTTWKQQARQRR